MDKLKMLQLQSLDSIGVRAAEMQKALEELSTLTNIFDIEAKMYFIAALGRRIGEIAKNYHNEMHIANSMPGEWHDDPCLHGINALGA